MAISYNVKYEASDERQTIEALLALCVEYCGVASWVVCGCG